MMRPAPSALLKAAVVLAFVMAAAPASAQQLSEASRVFAAACIENMPGYEKEAVKKGFNSVQLKSGQIHTGVLSSRPDQQCSVVFSMASQSPALPPEAELNALAGMIGKRVGQTGNIELKRRRSGNHYRIPTQGNRIDLSVEVSGGRLYYTLDN